MAHAMKNVFQSFDRLKKSGVPEAQARSIIEVIEEASEVSFKELTTKSDLKVTETLLRQEIQEVRTELKSEIQELRGDVHWLKKMFFGFTLLIVGNTVITLLHH